MDKINVGIIGYGLSAKVFHIPLILTTPSLALHSIVQRTPTPTNSAAKDHPNANIYTSTSDIFKDPSVSLVVITTSPDSHFSLCAAALESGKHVLVEKPFVPTSAEADTLIALSTKYQRLICVYQNRRWDTDFLTFRHLQSQGTLGRIVEFETHFDRHRPLRPADTWKGTLGMDQGGGAIYDLGTHLIDQVVVAFGMPQRVTAVFQHQRDDDIGNVGEPDALTLLLSYGQGCTKMLATVKIGVISLDTQQLRYWVRGSDGTYLKLHLDCQEEQLRAGMKPDDVGFGVESGSHSGMLTVLEGGRPIKRPFKNVEPETYAALYKAFVEAIRKGEEGLVPVKASEARDVLRVIEAARESAASGRTVEM